MPKIRCHNQLIYNGIFVITVKILILLNVAFLCQTCIQIETVATNFLSCNENLWISRFDRRGSVDVQSYFPGFIFYILYFLLLSNASLHTNLMQFITRTVRMLWFGRPMIVFEMVIGHSLSINNWITICSLAKVQ